ncbi:hypothetical protein SAMN02787142_8054 [Burkholderia sp. WP9]|uniref:hypothetical protein n=1 Tax=Burkholderia sp. WP9 TaxID=1500263 RepID=UPI0008981915|nr:hypothetical protein [Burkholderia sp. WP9]SEF13402.1 hypothetical protein SAMN02787142_8054 [Burkholderia sp. WP9]
MDFLPIAATALSIAPVVLGIVAILLGAGLGFRSLILYVISELLWRKEITPSTRPVREPRLSPDKVYEIHRAYIEHEDNLVNQRTTLMVTIQGLLLAAFGFGLQKFYEKVDAKLSCDFRDQLLHPIDTIQEVLPKLFPPENFQDLVVLEFNCYLLIIVLVGLATSLIGRISIGAAKKAILALEDHWNIYYYQSKVRPEQEIKFRIFPGISGGGKIKNRKRGISFVSWIPGFFVWLWILMLTARLVFMIAEGTCIKTGVPLPNPISPEHEKITHECSSISSAVHSRLIRCSDASSTRRRSTII